MIERLSEAMSAALVCKKSWRNLSKFHSFHFPSQKYFVVTAKKLQSIKTFWLLKYVIIARALFPKVRLLLSCVCWLGNALFPSISLLGNSTALTDVEICTAQTDVAWRNNHAKRSYSQFAFAASSQRARPILALSSSSQDTPTVMCFRTGSTNYPSFSRRRKEATRWWGEWLCEPGTCSQGGRRRSCQCSSRSEAANLAPSFERENLQGASPLRSSYEAEHTGLLLKVERRSFAKRNTAILALSQHSLE